MVTPLVRSNRLGAACKPEKIRSETDCGTASGYLFTEKTSFAFPIMASMAFTSDFARGKATLFKTERSAAEAITIYNIKARNNNLGIRMMNFFPSIKIKV